MYRLLLIFFLGYMIACSPQNSSTTEDVQDWTHYVRTAGHGLNKENIERTIQDAIDTHLFGIEVDNDPPGRYESFLDPSMKLEALRLLASRAHEIGNYAYVYVAGLECITAHADKTDHSFYKDHPDWVQRDINNRPAMFGGGDAFWITEGDEDVWITPYAKEWRTIYMKHIRDIAATGIDGVYVDIPYWMTHFDGWEDTWASMDDYTVDAFRQKTGLDARKDIRLGDFSDPGFRKWVDFRIESLTAFMAEIAENVRSVNPACKTIAEIYPGIGEEAVRVGADVYDMYPAVDVIAHEFSGGRGNAASKNPSDWFIRMTGMYTFRAFAEGKASWMLSYSWGDRNKIEPVEPMKNLALSNLMAGTNHWDARGHVMSGSNDIETRKELYKWIAENEKTFYRPRKPVSPVGVYFSPKTRDYHADQFMNSYQGIMQLILQGHLEFQVVTPRTLKDFTGPVLIMPDVKCISMDEVSILKDFLKKDKGLVFSAETGRYDITGKEYEKNPVLEIVGMSTSNEKVISLEAMKHFIYYPDCPGAVYSELLKKEFNEAAWKASPDDTEFHNAMKLFIEELEDSFKYESEIFLDAPPFVSSQIAVVDTKPHIFLANFSGLKRDENAVQIPVTGITAGFPNKTGTKIYCLPFLGKQSELVAEVKGDRVVCMIPELKKGAVIWQE